MIPRKRLPAVAADEACRNRPRLAISAGALALGGLFALGGANAATADSGRNLQPGSTVCTSRIASATGVTMRGSVTFNTASAMWTVQVASSPTGPESEFFRTATGPVTFELPSTQVVPPVAGTFYFRACVTQLGPLATNYTLFLNPRSAS
jgi:hypothetical protein